MSDITEGWSGRMGERSEEIRWLGPYQLGRRGEIVIKAEHRRFVGIKEGDYIYIAIKKVEKTV